MICCLDTNVVIDLLKGRQPRLATWFLNRRPSEIKIPEMVRAELVFGALKSQCPEFNLNAIERFLAPLELLPFAGEAVEHYGRIRLHLEKKGSPIGPADLVIAATACAAGATLVTNNRREFSRVPGLILGDRIPAS